MIPTNEHKIKCEKKNTSIKSLNENACNLDYRQEIPEKKILSLKFVNIEKNLSHFIDWQ